MSQNVVDFSGNPSGDELMDDYLDKEQENRLSCNSGLQRPSYALGGTFWLNTSSNPWVLNIYDGTDDITIGTVDITNNKFKVEGSLPAQEGNTGKLLVTNGTNAYWGNITDTYDSFNKILKLGV